eukprot:TRINITY_DN3848_c0_g4_i1.p1 TRINITY_DN3848_c0_g4~~TRINITY_DN3848_c0_g4_i1.p1  ORF type:complete len:221 (-),score=41.04 TRINITY_DN3848_c0_g4_i1:85-747(-)
MGSVISGAQDETVNIVILGFYKSGKRLFMKEFLGVDALVKRDNDEKALKIRKARFEVDKRKWMVWKFGGDEISRDLWHSIYKTLRVDVLICIFDSDNEDNFSLNIKAFHRLINEEELRKSLICLVYNTSKTRDSFKSKEEDNRGRKGAEIRGSEIKKLEKPEKLWKRTLDDYVGYDKISASTIKKSFYINLKHPSAFEDKVQNVKDWIAEKIVHVIERDY